MMIRRRMEDEDTRALIPPNSGPFSCIKNHKRCWIFLGVLSLILLINGIIIYWIYFGSVSSLKMMALNVWGIPGSFGSVNKEERIEAIAQLIKNSDYDIIFLSELWMEPDHTTIAKHLPKEYKMTGFRELSLGICDGRAAPTSCSGLALISKIPFKGISFSSYTDHGHWDEMFIDGEWLVRKGVGKVRITLPNTDNAAVDVFITHTIADAVPNHGYSNHDVRIKQVNELINNYVNISTADLVILGGDFNAPPSNEPDSPYSIIRKHLKNCVEDIYYELQKWLQPDFATYGNKENTFSYSYDPVIYDYIFYRSNNDKLLTWTNIFALPFFKFNLKGVETSVSDHEAIHATLYYVERKYSL